VSGVSEETARIVLARCNGMCEVCGRAAMANLHHRRARGMGGTRRAIHTPSWLLAVCGMGNTSGCHGRIETHREQARARGWLLGPSDDPATTPVLHAVYGWVILLDDGGFEYPDDVDTAGAPVA
jgi:hypothetical protein